MGERDRTQDRTDWDDDFGGPGYDRYEARGGYGDRGYDDRGYGEPGAYGTRGDWRYGAEGYGGFEDRGYGQRSGMSAGSGGQRSSGPGGYRRGGYGRFGRYDPYPGYDPYAARDAGDRFGGQPDWGRGGATGGYGTEDAAAGRFGRDEQARRYGGGRWMGERGYGQSRAGQGGYGRGGYGGGYGEGTEDRDRDGWRQFAREGRWRDRDRAYRDGGARETGFGEPNDVYNYWAVMWWQPGEFTGRGPRGYKRSDERITEDISDRLEQSGAIDATDIDVLVKDGKVTLEGKVDGKDQKRMAEDLAEACPGVRDVDNKLKVKRSLVGVFGGDKGHDDDERASRTSRARAGSNSGSNSHGTSTADVTAGSTAGSKTSSRTPTNASSSS